MTVGGVRMMKMYSSCPGFPSTPIKHKHMLFPPACSSPLITEDLPACPAAGVYFQ